MFLDENDCDAIIDWIKRKYIPPEPAGHVHQLYEVSRTDLDGNPVRYIHYCRKCGMKVCSVVIRYPYEKR